MTVEIIAEAAQGYLGDPPAKTRLLASMAAAAGADAVKFQLVYADELCTPDYVHYDLFAGLEMEDRDWQALADHCRADGIALYLDVFGPNSLALAERIGAPGVKLHSTDVLNLQLIEAVGASKVPTVVLSAGGAFEDEINRAVALLDGKDIVMMHGFQGYPTGNDENQVARLLRLRAQWPNVRPGFADHVPEDDPDGQWLAAVAIGAGATVIEKHLTIARALKEEDHESALGPDEFALFVSNMRRASELFGAAGDGNDFAMSANEHSYREKTKKQVVAERDLQSGVVLTAADLVLKRTPAEGAILRELGQAEGRTLVRSVAAGTALRPEDVT